MQRLLTPKNSDLLSDVYRAVRRLLIDHRHGGDEIAEALSMHRRTLNRRLQAQGTSFQHVLDGVRFQVARELLASDIALDDIAATLGYSTVTPFMRTFRRWSGTTPGRWRGMVRGSKRSGSAVRAAVPCLEQSNFSRRITVNSSDPLEWLRIATGRA